MIKTATRTIIILIIGMIVVVGAKIFTVYFIGELLKLTGPVPGLSILAVPLSIFYAFFLPPFIRWFHAQTREDRIRKNATSSLIQFFLALLGAAFVAVIVGATGSMLFIAERVNSILFWALIIFFMVLLFLAAYRYGKLEKRKSINRSNWWRG